MANNSMFSLIFKYLSFVFHLKEKTDTYYPLVQVLPVPMSSLSF